MPCRTHARIRRCCYSERTDKHTPHVRRTLATISAVVHACHAKHTPRVCQVAHTHTHTRCYHPMNLTAVMPWSFCHLRGVGTAGVLRGTAAPPSLKGTPIQGPGRGMQHRVVVACKEGVTGGTVVALTSCCCHFRRVFSWLMQTDGGMQHTHTAPLRSAQQGLALPWLLHPSGNAWLFEPYEVEEPRRGAFCLLGLMSGNCVCAPTTIAMPTTPRQLLHCAKYTCIHAHMSKSTQEPNSILYQTSTKACSFDGRHPPIAIVLLVLTCRGACRIR